jgi:hypothetical protein
MSGKNAGKDMKLLFDGWYLKLQVGGVVDSAQHARSGLPVGNEFDYSVTRQQEKDAGPVPEGEYWIVPAELGSPRLASAESWGKYRITIHQYPNTNAYGRGGFFIHGGIKFGSKGCIDLAGFMDHFVRRLNDLLPPRVLDVPQRVVLKPTCYIPLTIKYGSPRVDMPPWFNV